MARDPEGRRAIKKLGDEITNLEAVLLEGLELRDPTLSIDAAVDVAAVTLYSGLDTTQVLQKACDVAERCKDVLRQAHCLRRMGDVAQRRASIQKPASTIKTRLIFMGKIGFSI